jgi:cysteine desulfuration protein SufE
MPTPGNPSEPTEIARIEDEIVAEFDYFTDWSERYQYLIDLGRRVPALAPEQRTEEHRVHGCQSNVWLVPHGDARRLEFQATSDSSIVQGLIALILRLYSGRSADAILAAEPRFVERIGLGGHLSPTRKNGLAAMLARVKQYARAALEGARYP